MLFPSEPARRLFIGLMPGPGVQAALRQHGRYWDWPAGSWLTRPQRLHLTLHFLGAVCLSREQRLREALHDTPMAPLDLVLSTPQAWRGGVAVLRPDAQPGLDALHENIAQVLWQLGMRPMGHWTPHVTLARRAAQARPPDAPAAIPWTVCEFVLVWSRLPPAEPVARYEVLARYGAH